MEKEDGGPAFPRVERIQWAAPHDINDMVVRVQGGMSLRDYFAAAALTGLAIKYGVDEEPGAIGAEALAMADAMLAARQSK